MDIAVTLKSRNKNYSATGRYIDSKNFVVCKGSQIYLNNDSVVSKKVMKFRENSEYVDKNGVVLKDCTFGSPSTAAQFVNGSSTNGYVAWKVGKQSLKEYLAEIGSEV